MGPAKNTIMNDSVHLNNDHSRPCYPLEDMFLLHFCDMAGWHCCSFSRDTTLERCFPPRMTATSLPRPKNTTLTKARRPQGLPVPRQLPKTDGERRQRLPGNGLDLAFVAKAAFFCLDGGLCFNGKSHVHGRSVIQHGEGCTGRESYYTTRLHTQRDFFRFLFLRGYISSILSHFQQLESTRSCQTDPTLATLQTTLSPSSSLFQFQSLKTHQHASSPKSQHATSTEF